MKNHNITESHSPIIALALHDGHYIPPAFQSLSNLSEFERMREEDPYTAQFIERLHGNKVIVHTSRFFVDLNRPWQKAIYLEQEDAWGLKVWRERPSNELIDLIKSYYTSFYEQLGRLVNNCLKRFGYFVILDIHSYNYRRKSPYEEDTSEDNPEINIGTQHNDEKWHSATERFIAFLQSQHLCHRHPDVRENIKFKGGGLAQWIGENYKKQGFTLSIEFKKTFMDEWTGRANIAHINEISQLMADASLFLRGTLATRD
ncbi:N-formylglutamate amidohydrolase [Olivibacter sitiensis]|uniref:N-formylglutamate amidohydrolase n=1 Tax=Olivibacter sitiensis TaxID=376470 RepID=UPI00042A1EC6|nr:N-formylglutamate amidohydrolase [Olivibacter sitiensis]